MASAAVTAFDDKRGHYRGSDESMSSKNAAETCPSPSEGDAMLKRPVANDEERRKGSRKRKGKRGQSWRQVWYDYSQTTSLNGVPHITAPTPVPARR